MKLRTFDTYRVGALAGQCLAACERVFDVEGNRERVMDWLIDGGEERLAAFLMIYQDGVLLSAKDETARDLACYQWLTDNGFKSGGGEWRRR